MEWENVIDGNCTLGRVFISGSSSSQQNLNAPYYGYYVNAKNIFTLDNDLPQWHLCHDTRARA
jgi:hypothetical protein